MGTVEDFNALVLVRGSDVRYHKDESAIPCPCRTPEGFRDPIWHIQNPAAPVCNEAGMLPQPGTTADFIFKGWVQPVQSGAVRRLTSEQIVQLFGEIQSDDHVGIFPVQWEGNVLNFYDWGEATEDWVEYNGRRFTIVNTNLLAAPDTGNPWHHWELGLRLIGKTI